MRIIAGHGPKLSGLVSHCGTPVLPPVFKVEVADEEDVDEPFAPGSCGAGCGGAGSGGDDGGDSDGGGGGSGGSGCGGGNGGDGSGAGGGGGGIAGDAVAAGVVDDDSDRVDVTEGEFESHAPLGARATPQLVEASDFSQPARIRCEPKRNPL